MSKFLRFLSKDISVVRFLFIKSLTKEKALLQEKMKKNKNSIN